MKQVAKTTKSSKPNKRKAEREKRRGEIRREVLAHEAILILRGDGAPMAVDEILALIPSGGGCSGRALSAAMRVARKDGRVLFDGKRYSLPASAPATSPAPPPFSADGPLTRVDDAPVTPTLPSPRPQTIVPPARQPAPGAARDLAERQAFGYSTARERIASVLRGAGLTEATAAQPGVIVRVHSDGRLGLRWGVKHADGSTASCAWTESAERLMERAANALHNAGYRASVGAPTPPPEPRAPRPSEAAERIAALEAELATTKNRLAAVNAALTSTTLALTVALNGGAS